MRRLGSVILMVIVLLVVVSVVGSRWGVPAVCESITSATSPRFRIHQCAANYLLTKVTASSAVVSLPKIPIPLVLRSTTVAINWLRSLIARKVTGEVTAMLLGGILHIQGSGDRSSFSGAASLKNSQVLEIPLLGMLGFAGGSLSASFPTLEISAERLSGHGTVTIAEVIASASPLTLGIPLTNTTVNMSISLGSHGADLRDIEISDEQLGSLRGKVAITGSTFLSNIPAADLSGSLTITLTALGREKLAPLLGISDLREGSIQAVLAGTVGNPTLSFEPGI